jgi:hypothetical protein
MAIKRAILGLLLLISAPIIVIGASSIGVNNFSGLDTQDNPAALQPGQSQDLLNVRLQPGGKSVFKRDVYGLFQTLGSSKPVHGGYHFQQTSGSDVQLWGSSTTLYSSVNDGSFVAIATGTFGATWQCTDNLGYAYCVTSFGDMPVKTDGSVGNTTYQPTIPAGTMITSTPLQLVVAGVSGNASSIYFSANNNFTNFTTGPLPTDPYVEIINSPGSRLTHLGFYFGNLYWWKDQSVGYVSGSASQGTVGITIISNQIGTLDNSSAFWNPTTYDQGNKFNTGTQTTTSGNPYFNEMSSLGGIFFRGQDNHVYQYDGYTLTRLSRIITPNIVGSSRHKAGSWNQTTQYDFSGGSAYATHTDTTTQSGAVVIQQYSNIANASSYTQIASTISNVSGGLLITSTATSPFSVASGSADMGAVNIGANWNLQFSFFRMTDSFNSLGFIGKDISGNGYGVIASWQTSPNHFFVYPVKYSAGVASFISSYSGYDTGYAIDLSSHTCTFSISASGAFHITFDTSSYSGSDTSFTVDPATISYELNNTGVGVSSWTVTSLYLNASTGTYYSAVNNAPNLSTWGSFTASDSLPGISSITYFTRSSTNNFTVTSSTPTWVLQPKNSNVATSTGTYFQERSDFYVSAATENPSLNDFTFNWFEGSATDKAYINYFQDAIWFSVSSGSSTSTNNTIFYLDLLNNTWLKDDIAANGFAVENNYLYIGSPLTSEIYRFGGVPTDNSLPIHSYWKSMEFSGQDPTVQNSFEQADFSFAESSNTVSFTYAVDQSASPRTVLIPLYSSRTSIVKRGFALSLGAIGTYFDFKIEDNSSLPAWTMMGQRTTYVPLPWRPQTSQ